MIFPVRTKLKNRFIHAQSEFKKQHTKSNKNTFKNFTTPFDYGILRIRKEETADWSIMCYKRLGTPAVAVMVKQANDATASWKQLATTDDIPVIATQAEAEAGTDNTNVMTPLRTIQEIDSKRPLKTFTNWIRCKRKRSGYCFRHAT